MGRLIDSGTLTYLRVHDLRSGYGPANDKIEGEVVFKLSGNDDRALGFELRDDAARPSHQGMLDLLRDAFTHGWTVTTEFDVPDAPPGRKNGTAIRIWLTRPRPQPQRAEPRRIVVPADPADS